MGFHINPSTDEPGECKPTKTGICGFAQDGKIPEHYDTMEAALGALGEKYEKVPTKLQKGSHNRVRMAKKYAPEKPELEPVTFEEAQSVLNRVRNHAIENIKNSVWRKRKVHLTDEEAISRISPVLRNSKPIGYGLLGSSLYALEHPDSDRDVVIIVPGKGHSEHAIYDDGTDAQIISFDTFRNSFNQSQPNLVDTLYSRQFTMTEEYAALRANMRFDPIAYRARIYDHGMSDLLRARDDFGSNDHRASKALKTSTRLFYLAHRADQGEFRTEFTPDEREHFYETFTKAEELMKETSDAQQVIAYVYERSHKSKLDPSVDWIAEASQTERRKNNEKRIWEENLFSE